MMKFNDLNHQVIYRGVSVELQPLSFKLLKLLHETPNATVNIEAISNTVWNKTTVSPETLKQRVFLLRKALTEAGLEDLDIQSIRGEGYRLNLASSKLQAVRSNANKSTLQLIVVFLFVATAVWLFWPQTSIPVNNRLVLWTKVNSNTSKSELESIRQVVKSALISATKSGALQLIESTRNPKLSISSQARNNRAGLIVILEMINQQDARAHIIEPQTATLLATKELTGMQNQRQQAAAQIVTIAVKLIQSGKLILTKAIRNNSNHPKWNELRAIAQEVDTN